MDSYQFLTQKAASLPAPLQQDPQADDVAYWSTPTGHSVRHVYDAERLAKHRAMLEGQLSSLHTDLDDEAHQTALMNQSARRTGNTLGGALLGGALAGFSPMLAGKKPSRGLGLLGALGGGALGASRKVPYQSVQLHKDYSDPVDLAEEGRVPVPAMYGLKAQDRVAAAHRAMMRDQLASTEAMRREMRMRDVRHHLEQWDKHANDQNGYATTPPAVLSARKDAPGAAALPPLPTQTPTTKEAGGGMLDDIETALRRRRLMQHAQQSALGAAEPLADSYRTARNRALKGVGLRGLGLGLGGLALYGMGRYGLNKLREPASEPSYQPMPEDFMG